MATALKPHEQEAVLARAQRVVFPAWLREEFIDRRCDAAEFSRRYGFARSTVRAWISGRRVPSLDKCRELAAMLDLTAVEVIAAAGYITFLELDEYNRAYASSDDLSSVVMIGE